MQLGTRWPSGTPAPLSLDNNVRDAIYSVEQDLQELSQDTSSWHWTLTFLEGRPVVQLDDGTTIRVDAAGTVSIRHED